MSYTERDIIAMCEEAIKCPDTFYQNKFVNYKGFCKGNVKKLYTEIIADYLLKNIDKLNTIRTINRDKSYRITSHIGQKTNSNRREENLAIEMFHKKRCEFGMVLDYQIPLKNKQSDKGIGKIDLLAKKEDCIYILELKREDNTETLLRCILEVFTYFKQVNHSRLLQDYNIEPKVKILAAPLIYKEGFQYQEYNDTKKHNKVIELMERLGVSSPFTYDSSRLYNNYSQRTKPDWRLYPRDTVAFWFKVLFSGYGNEISTVVFCPIQLAVLSADLTCNRGAWGIRLPENLSIVHLASQE